jgi:hypothetical protein
MMVMHIPKLFFSFNQDTNIFLSICGKFIPLPWIKNRILTMLKFNGDISDTESVAFSITLHGTRTVEAGKLDCQAFERIHIVKKDDGTV